MQTQTNNGFTLVELSIVLVIIGLLIGGILVGQSLIESAKINAQIKQLQQFDIATNNFKTKFKCLPADCSRVGFVGFVGAPPQFGDGNGLFDANTSAANGNWVSTEQYHFFSALSSSGMVNKTYGHCNGSGNCSGAAGANWSGLIGSPGLWPELKIAPKKGMMVVGGKDGSIHYFLGINQSGMAFYSGIADLPIILPIHAAALDSKLDDGFASTGNVFASTNLPTAKSACTGCTNTDPTVMQLDVTNGACTNSGTPRTYNSTSTSLCRVVIKAEVN